MTPIPQDEEAADNRHMRVNQGRTTDHRITRDADNSQGSHMHAGSPQSMTWHYTRHLPTAHSILHYHSRSRGLQQQRSLPTTVTVDQAPSFKRRRPLSIASLRVEYLSLQKTARSSSSPADSATQGIDLSKPPKHEADKMSSKDIRKGQSSKKQTDPSEAERKDYLKTAPKPDREIPRMVIGARELCTYIPYHVQWPRYTLRLTRNGWQSKTIAKAQLHARGDLNQANLQRREWSVRQQIRTNGIAYYDDEDWSHREWLASTHSDSYEFDRRPPGGRLIDLYDISRDDGVWDQSVGGSWAPSGGLGDIVPGTPLLELVQGVIHHPTGEDAGPLTQALLWAMQPARPAFYLQNTTIDDLPNIIATQGFVPPQEASNTARWDQKALERLNRSVPDP